MDIATKAVVTRADGSNVYREQHEFFNLTDEQAKAVTDAIDKHAQYLHQLDKDQKKEPTEVLTAVFSCTGQPDLTFAGFTFDTFQKAHKAWGKVGDDMVAALEKSLKHP